MRYGAINKISAHVKSVKKGDITSLVKFNVTAMVDTPGLKNGDMVELAIKAIHMLVVKE